jgi:hypothetical protein
MAVTFVSGLGAGGLVGRAAALAGDDAVRASQSDVPVTLADLELAQLGRAELGDQRRQELLRQARDPGVIRPTSSIRDAPGRPVAAFFALGACVGQRSDLLVGRRLVAP